jgi:hypothetical protein
MPYSRPKSTRQGSCSDFNGCYARGFAGPYFHDDAVNFANLCLLTVNDLLVE